MTDVDAGGDVHLLVTAAFRHDLDAWLDSSSDGRHETLHLHSRLDGRVCGRVRNLGVSFDGGRDHGRVVDVALRLGALRLDTIVALSAPTSSLPHFTFEMASNPSGTFLSIDLIPKVDLIANPGYVASVYEPLEIPRWEAISHPGISGARARGIHHMLLSPWLLAVSVPDPTAAAPAARAAESYFSHWTTLAGDEPPPVSVEPDRLAQRDAASRPRLYSSIASENWDRLDGVLSPGEGEMLRALLAGDPEMSVDPPSGPRARESRR